MIRVQSQFRHTRAHPLAHVVFEMYSYSQPLQAQAPAVVFGTKRLTNRSASVFNVERIGSPIVGMTVSRLKQAALTPRSHFALTKNTRACAHSHCANEFPRWPGPGGAQTMRS